MSDATEQALDPSTLTAGQQQIVSALRDRDALTLPAVKHEALAAIEQALVARFPV